MGPRDQIRRRFSSQDLYLNVGESFGWIHRCQIPPYHVATVSLTLEEISQKAVILCLKSDVHITEIPDTVETGYCFQEEEGKWITNPR